MAAALAARGERFEINASFDPRRGYYTTGSELPTVTASELAGLRRRIEQRMTGVDVRLVLDRAARRECDRRRASMPRGRVEAAP
jgi:hypothetical protein